MNVNGYKSWLIASSIVFLVLLIPAFVSSLLTHPVYLQLLSLIVVGSYATLWWALGAGLSVANAISFLRVVLLVCAALSSLWGERDLTTLILLTAILSDALDGYIARRMEQATAAGAVLDMEADQNLVLVMALLAAQTSEFGVLLLLLPALKYCSVLASAGLGRPLLDPKPVAGDNRRAKSIYVLVLMALVLEIQPYPLGALPTIFSALAIPALCASFALDFVHQLRSDGAPS